MRSVLKAHQKMLLAGAVALLVLFGIDRALALRVAYFKSMDVQVSKAATELAVAQQLLMEKGVIERAEGELSLKGESPEKGDSASLISSLDALAEESGVSITNLRPAAGLEPLAVTLLLDGTWPAAVKFFAAAQSRPYFLDIRELRMASQAIDQKQLRFECVLSVPVR